MHLRLVSENHDSRTDSRWLGIDLDKATHNKHDYSLPCCQLMVMERYSNKLTMAKAVRMKRRLRPACSVTLSANTLRRHEFKRTDKPPCTER